MVTLGWSEPAITNAPVEDEPVQPVLRMNILLAHRDFFFTSSLPRNSLPPPSYLPPPTYHLPSQPPLLPPPSYLPPTSPTPPHSIAKAPETSSGCGARAGAMAVERELERLELERDPRAHEKVRCLRFYFIFFVCFVWRRLEKSFFAAAAAAEEEGLLLLLPLSLLHCSTTTQQRRRPSSSFLQQRRRPSSSFSFFAALQLSKKKAFFFFLFLCCSTAKLQHNK